METQQSLSENNSKLDKQLEMFDEMKISMEEEEDEKYWYNPNIIKDISKGVQKKLWTVIIVCCLFIVVEAIGAYLSDSVAIFTDVTHLLSDLIGFIISALSVSLASRKASLKRSYGYIRAESIGALFSVILIWALTAWIFIKSVDKLITNNYDSLDPFYMLVSALFGFFVNCIMAFCLHSHEGISHGHGGCGHTHSHTHGHTHGHSHHHHDHDHKDHHHHEHNHQGCKNKSAPKDYHVHEHPHGEDYEDQKKDRSDSYEESGLNATYNDSLQEKLVSKKKKLKNISMIEVHENHNIRAAWIHILGDMVQSLGVVIFSTIIYFKQDWKFLDPIISIVFVVIATSFSIPVARSIILMLLDSTPENLDIERFSLQLQSLKYVKEVHDLHVWNLSYGKPSMTAHIIVDDMCEYVLKKATIECRKVGIYHSTIQVELFKPTHKINCEHNLHC